MSVMELNQQDRGFSTLHREEVVRRVVRRIASVLDLDDFNDRLDLSGVPDSPAGEQDVLTVGCRQLGVYVKHLNSLTDEQALDVVREGHVVVILHKDGEYSIIERQLGRNVEITTVNGTLRHGTISQNLIPGILTNNEAGIYICQRELACESISSHASDEDQEHHEHLSPFRRFVRLLRLELNDIWTVVLFALVSGVLALSTPLAVESLVNVVSWGTYVQPLIVLALILLASLGLAGVLKVLQTVVVEIIQRRQFVRIVGDLAHRFPRATQSYLKKHYPRELANRMFDIMTIQKATAVLLLDGVSIILTTILGMALLAFYHPFLLGFNIALLIAMSSIIWVLGRDGIKTSIDESIAKYEIVHWLQDVISYPGVFKINGGEDMAVEKANSLAADYLVARESQFRVVIRQVAFAIGLQVFASTALLGLGGWLVIGGQLTLGQLVASELVVTVVVGAFAKAGKSLEKFYDLMAGIDKVGHLLDIPVDPRRGRLSIDDEPCAVEWTDLTLQHGASQRRISAAQFDGGLALALAGNDLIARSLLCESVAGLSRPYGGTVTVAEMDALQAGRAGRGRLVAVANRHEVFHGTVTENVLLGRPGIGEDRCRDVLKVVGLWDTIHALPNGLSTSLETGGYPLVGDQLARLALARSIAAGPKLLVIDSLMDELPPADRLPVFEALRAAISPCTIILSTSDPALAAECDQQLELGV